MQVLLTIVLVLLIFGFLVFVHEAGHFIAARLNGVYVEEFAFGFGPKIWGRKIGNTEYKINIIPLGGYVKMFGDADPSSFVQDKALRNDHRSYVGKAIWQKMTIVLAGVIVNFIVAALIFYVFLASQSFKPDPIAKIVGYNFIGSTQYEGLFYDYVEKGSPADKQSVPPAGFVVAVNGDKNVADKSLKDIFSQKEGNLTVSIAKFGDYSVQDYTFNLNSENPSAGIYLLNTDEQNKLGLEGKDFLLYDGVVKDGAAEKNNLPEAGVILEVNGEQIKDNNSLADVLNKNENKEVTVKILGIDKKQSTYKVTLGSKDKDGRVKLGIFPSVFTNMPTHYYLIDYSPYKIFSGFAHAINVSGYQLLGLAQLVSNAFAGKPQMLFESVGSPIKIGEVVYSEVSATPNIIDKDFILRMANLTGLLSATLAFMNMLPIPIVDGGQFYLLCLEKLRGRPMSEKKQDLLGKIGFTFLIILSIAVLLKDFWQVILSKIFKF